MKNKQTVLSDVRSGQVHAFFATLCRIRCEGPMSEKENPPEETQGESSHLITRV